MKNLHPIHQSPEQQTAVRMGEIGQLSQATVKHLSLLNENLKKLATEYPALHDGLAQISYEVAKGSDRSKVISKLEEIKSAGLVANRLLKDIREAVSKEHKCPEMKEVDFSQTNALLAELIKKVEAEKNVTVTLSII